MRPRLVATVAVVCVASGAAARALQLPQLPPPPPPPPAPITVLQPGPARPATDGAFSIRNLPPGEYYLAALTDLDPAEWQTPAFLGQLAPVSLKFTLTDGQKLKQDLRVQ